MIRKVAVIMGSDSDWPVVKGACAQLKALDIPFEAHILSAHRTPAEAADFAKKAKADGFGVILCAAGMAAHLAGAFAANTTLPVIGIPMKGGAMDGLDALLATVQMPSALSCAQAPFTTGQSLSEPMITATLRIITKSLSFSYPANKKGCGTPVPRPLFLRILSRSFTRSCTMPLTCANLVSTHVARQHLLH